jgi:hypothetical protein
MTSSAICCSSGICINYTDDHPPQVRRIYIRIIQTQRLLRAVHREAGATAAGATAHANGVRLNYLYQN